jgi:hypothetical protein
MISFFIAAAKLTWLSVRHPNTSWTMVIKDRKAKIRGERPHECGITEIIGGLACERCHGSGSEPDYDSVYYCRVLPPKHAQEFHELQQMNLHHDTVECYCCCTDCPGWTEDMEIMSDEEIADIIPCHDHKGGKPFPLRECA